MALIVETGAGLAGADAFASVAYVDAYATDRALSGWTGIDAAKEAAIRRSTAYLSAGYQWKGVQAQGRAQALAWPRSGAQDHDGFPIAGDSVPPEVARACAELAVQEIVTPGVLSPTIALADRVKREKVGAVEVEYQDHASTETTRAAIDAMLAPLVAGSGSIRLARG